MVKITVSYETDNEKEQVLTKLRSLLPGAKIKSPEAPGEKYRKLYITMK